MFERTIIRIFLSLYKVQFVWSINVLSKFNFFERTLIQKNVQNRAFRKNSIRKKKMNFKRTLFYQLTSSHPKWSKNLTRIIWTVPYESQKNNCMPLRLFTNSSVLIFLISILHCSNVPMAFLSQFKLHFLEIAWNYHLNGK
jgi:hypothetical protein